MDASSSDEEWDPNQGVQPITKTFEILDAIEGCPKPFYIYKFVVWRAQKNSQGKRDSTLISDRVHRLVFKKAIDKWLAENQHENNFYHVPATQDIVLTQFAFQSPRSANDRDKDDRERINFFKGQVAIKNPVSTDTSLSSPDETFNFCFSPVVPPVLDLKRSTNHWDVRGAAESIILADIEQDGRFASTQLNKVYKFFGAENERRTISLGSCLRMILGLQINVENIRPAHVEGEPSSVLKIREIWHLFFEPVNMVELLREHFKFDITKPLERNQIDRLNQKIDRQTVEMRIEGSFCDNLSEDKGSDESLSENDITCIWHASFKAVADELNWCSSYGNTNKPTSDITVEEQFRREFPNTKLQYTHLPCVITTRGRKIPMEVCWIKPGVCVAQCASPEEMSKLKQLTRGERMEIFDENCRELLEDYGTTLKRFGFKLRPA